MISFSGRLEKSVLTMTDSARSNAAMSLCLLPWISSPWILSAVVLSKVCCPIDCSSGCCFMRILAFKSPILVANPLLFAFLYSSSNIFRHLSPVQEMHLGASKSYEMSFCPCTCVKILWCHMSKRYVDLSPEYIVP